MNAKPLFISAVAMAALWSLNPAAAAVVQTPGLIRVEAFLDGGLIGPGDIGDTMDYLTFEVLTTSTITVSGTNLFGETRLMLAEFIGREDRFVFLGNPYLLTADPTPNAPPPYFSRVLDPGTYVIALGRNVSTSYDIGDGFVPVNTEGGGFLIAPCVYEISGPVRAVEFRDGELDGTFKTTTFPVPEPAAPLLGAAALAFTAGRRRRPRREG